MSELTDRLRAAAHRIKVRLRFSQSSRPVGAHRVVNPWSSVSIRPGLVEACPAAKALGEKRFLSKEAPSIPLPDCTLPEKCACRFIHHADRRAGPRRAFDCGLPPPNYMGPERRREAGGRRYGDD